MSFKTFFVLSSTASAQDFAKSLERKVLDLGAYISLPSYENLPAASASSDCCHFGVIVCVMHLQISALKTEKWTRQRTSTSEYFLCAIVVISLIPSYPASALVGTWTRDLSLTKGVLYRWATRAVLKWAGLDLNQRRQSQRIYSPPPLTTRAPTPTNWTYQLMDTLCEIILVFFFLSR